MAAPAPVETDKDYMAHVLTIFGNCNVLTEKLRGEVKSNAHDIPHVVREICFVSLSAVDNCCAVIKNLLTPDPTPPSLGNPIDQEFMDKLSGEVATTYQTIVQLAAAAGTENKIDAGTRSLTDAQLTAFQRALGAVQQCLEKK